MYILNIISPVWICVISWQWCNLFFCNCLLFNFINSFNLLNFMTIFIRFGLSGRIIFFLFLLYSKKIRYWICLFIFSFSSFMKISSLFFRFIHIVQIWFCWLYISCNSRIYCSWNQTEWNILRRGISQDVTYNLILWYASKIVYLSLK